VSWEDERRSLLEGVSAHKLEFEVLEETYQRALALGQENGWTESDIPLIVFSHGLAFLLAERELTRINRDGADARLIQELERAVRQMMEESSKYAALKFKAYRMSQDNQALEMREAGLNAELLFSKRRMIELRDEVERLRPQLRALEAENASLRQQIERLSGGAVPPPENKSRGPFAWFRRRT